MEAQIQGFNEAGGCFLCSAADYDPTTESPGLTRRRFLSGSALASATLNPANGLKREDLGRIAVGAKADLCTIDVSGFLTGVGTAPPEPLNNLLYANGLCVRHVMTDGNFQFYDGRMVVDDEARVLQRGGAVVAKIWEQLRTEKWFEA